MDIFFSSRNYQTFKLQNIFVIKKCYSKHSCTSKKYNFILSVLLPLQRIPHWTKAINVIPGTTVFFTEFCVYWFYIYWFHWIVSKPISYSRIIIMNSFFFVPYSNLQNKIKRDISLFKKHLTWPESIRTLHLLFSIFCSHWFNM